MVDQWEIVDTVTGGVGVYMANTAKGMESPVKKPL
jgi:hypothetical protein